MKKSKDKKGFSYYIEDSVLREYKGLSADKKLSWLEAVNVMDAGLSRRVRKLHEKFRKAII